MAPEPTPQSRTLVCADGARLAATWFPAPAGVEVLGVGVFAGAMGVPRRAYRAFARHLAGRGFPVLTFDYCGIADSRPALEQRPDVTIEDWALLDLPAAIEAAAREHPGAPLIHLAHSVGGQILGLCPEAAASRYRAAVIVASQVGAWRLWRGPSRFTVWGLWHVLIPVTTRWLGRFPSAWFGMGETLPREVARQWARWGRARQYLFDLPSRHTRTPPRHAELRIPIFAVGMADDLYAPPAAMAALLDRYAQCEIERREIGPADPEPRPGHFTWFREELGRRYWDEVIDFLRRRLAGHASTAATP